MNAWTRTTSIDISSMTSLRVICIGKNNFKRALACTMSYPLNGEDKKGGDKGAGEDQGKEEGQEDIGGEEVGVGEEERDGVGPDQGER